MKKIYIEISDEEFKEIGPLLNFIKVKIGIKKAFLQGLFNILERDIEDEKILKVLKETKKRIGMM